MKTRLALLLPGLAALALAAPANAGKPEIVENVRFDGSVTELDPFFTEACGFDVFVTTKGHFTFKVYFDRDGNIKRFVGHPSMAHTFSSEFGSFDTADRGVDKISENPDGTVRIQGTGIHFKEQGGPRATGLWILTIDPETEELLDAEYHGHFDLEQDEIDAYICSRLGPQA
jgi:hypothetical protein